MHRTTGWLLLAFVVSVIVRAPLLDRPLSKHHDFCTATALNVLTVWHERGIARVAALPALTFAGRANESMFDQTDGRVQQGGVQFYLSHMPFAYYLPWAVFSVVHIAPDVLPLRCLNLLFHLLTTLMLAALVRLLCQERTAEMRERAALIAGCLYLFMPAMLWYHGNVYMADMFVQNVWILNLYAAVRLFWEERPSLKWIVLFGCSLALTAFTEWLGVFAGMCAFLLSVRRWWYARNTTWLVVAAVVFAAVVIPVAGTLQHYASIAGWQPLIAHYGFRFADRGSVSFGGSTGLLYFIWRLLFNYLTAFLPLLVLMLCAWWHTRKGAVLGHPRSVGPMFVWLAGAPVVLDHLVFLKYAVQEFAVLKASFLLCVLAACWLADAVPLQRSMRWSMGACACGVILFYVINPPGERSITGERYATPRSLGKAMAAAVDDTDAVFVSTSFPRDPMVIFYARRNMQRVVDVDEARRFLHVHHLSGGVLFRQEANGLSYERVR